MSCSVFQIRAAQFSKYERRTTCRPPLSMWTAIVSAAVSRSRLEIEKVFSWFRILRMKIISGREISQNAETDLDSCRTSLGELRAIARRESNKIHLQKHHLQQPMASWKNRQFTFYEKILWNDNVERNFDLLVWRSENVINSIFLKPSDQ